ncbi:MAG: YbjN domain-containing protein [Pseudomonadota bacterium]
MISTTASLAEDQGVVLTKASMTEVIYIALQHGYEIKDIGENNGDPYVVVVVDDVAFFVVGRVCNEEEKCDSLEMISFFPKHPNITLEDVNRINGDFPQVSVAIVPDQIAISRHLILDYGVTEGNIRYNMSFFSFVLDTVEEALKAAAID